MRGLACPVKNSGTEGLGEATDKPFEPRGTPKGFSKFRRASWVAREPDLHCPQTGDKGG